MHLTKSKTIYGQWFDIHECWEDIEEEIRLILESIDILHQFDVWKYPKNQNVVEVISIVRKITDFI